MVILVEMWNVVGNVGRGLGGLGAAMVGEMNRGAEKANEFTSCVLLHAPVVEYEEGA